MSALLTHGAVAPEEGAAYFKDMMERNGYCGICVQGMLRSSRGAYPRGNADAMAISRLLPGSYAFAGMDHSRDFVEQTREYMAEGFFRKYHTRILYGTDADSALKGFAREYNDTKVEIITHFLEGDLPKEIAGYRIHPIRLEPEMLEDIYYNNALRFIKK